MKKIFVFSVLSILHIIHSSVFGSTLQNEVISGLVIDESGMPIPNSKVSIDESEYYTSGPDGKFKFSPTKKLVMPFEVAIVKKGYKMKEFTFSDSDNEIEVIVKKINSTDDEEVVVKIFDDQNKAIKNTKVTVEGVPFITDGFGKLVVKNKVTDKTKITMDGYVLSPAIFNKKENYYKITAQLQSPKNSDIVSKIVTEEPLNPPLDTMPQKSLNEKVFEQYKGDFDELTNEIIAERIRVEGNNKKIRDEIVAITSRLQNEKNLTKDQRKALQKYVEKLENTLLENTIAFQKSQERTNFLISRLKNIIMEKDAINTKALERIKVVEKENRITQRKFKRNLIVFSIITSALLLLAVVFYSIAVKMRKQKKALLKSNEEMQGIKEQLAQSLILIEEQKKQIFRN